MRLSDLSALEGLDDVGEDGEGLPHGVQPVGEIDDGLVIYLAALAFRSMAGRVLAERGDEIEQSADQVARLVSVGLGRHTAHEAEAWR